MKAALIVVATVLTAVSQVAAFQYPTYGAIGGLSDVCLTELNNIFNNKYLLNSQDDSQDTRKNAWYLTPTRRLGCRLLLLEGFENLSGDNCPTEEDLKNCFWVAHNDWVHLANHCQVFKSQVPLPKCSDSPGEAAEGVPSCNTDQAGIDTSNTKTSVGRRRLLQGPANDAGIATWAFSYGESQGLQFDPYALPGSPAAAPPLASNIAAATGSDAAALRIAAEGNEGAAIGGGGLSTAVNAGCFPSFWTGADFQTWLNTNSYKERPRPKDIGGVNAIGVVSVLIYAIALSSLALV